MNEVNLKMIQDAARSIRYNTVSAIGSIGEGHIGGSLSIADLLAVLYFHAMKNIDPHAPKQEGRDRFIMSKGHAGPALYAALAVRGYFPTEMLKTLNRLGTNLPSHCDMNRTPGIDMTTGSLGQGFSCAVGVAIGSKIANDNATIYALVGDGESQEGQVWEAAMYANQKKLDNLIAFTDYNRKQIDGTTDEVNTLHDLKAKWEAFGWHTAEIDGHDHLAIVEAIEEAKKHTGKPSMIILDTVKGKGVSFVEAAGVGNHNMPMSAEQVAQAHRELSGEV